MLNRILPVLFVIFLNLLLPAEKAICQGAYQARRIIGDRIKTIEFRELVTQICDPATNLIPDSDLKRSNVFFRLTERKYVLSGDKLNKQAAIGGSPYVFLTVPQTGFGRSLFEIYTDLGYDAEGILRKRNRHMVAIVLRYEPEIKFSPERDGHGSLDKADYDQYVYVPTWNNAYAMFSRLARDKNPDPKNPFPMRFSDESNRNLAQFFPADKRKHISQLPYPLLRTAGGPDWAYRQLLESK